MAWTKKGRIFTLEDHDISWAKSHACVPTALPLDNGRIRIYYAPRNENGQSIPTFFEVLAENPSTICYVHKTPVMNLGILGTFDDGGNMPCCVVKVDELIYLYYVGWNPSVSVAYRNAIGLAISEDGGITFRKAFDGAIVDRNRDEPFFTASPWIMREKPDLWHMWYASSTGFLTVNQKVEPLYIIKYAHSTNGIDWVRTNHTCIHPLHSEEANARATVIKDENGTYKMWFAYRGSRDFRDGDDAYRIGYAESTDALHWTRLTKNTLAYSDAGWDSKMQTYPNVIEVGSKRYLFYNGNGFGKSGIGYALWENENNNDE